MEIGNTSRRKPSHILNAWAQSSCIDPLHHRSLVAFMCIADVDMYVLDKT